MSRKHFSNKKFLLKDAGYQHINRYSLLALRETLRLSSG